MERVIDRSAYRRNTLSTSNTKYEVNEDFFNRIRKILYQILISAITFLFLTLAKKYNIEPVISWAESSFNNQINIAETYKYVQSKFEEMQAYLRKFNVDDILNSESENIPLIENSSTQIEDEVMVENNKYEEAVEGVNQMIDDAEYIKAHYNLKHAIQGTVTSIFGVRESDNKIVTHYHSGIDVAANKGTNICASISGEVVTAATDVAYGKYIMIQTDNMVTLYAHCSELKVKKGQKVKQGEVIAKVGSTGWSTGPHLHFEIRLDGRLVDPADVLDYSKMGV